MDATRFSGVFVTYYGANCAGHTRTDLYTQARRAGRFGEEGTFKGFLYGLVFVEVRGAYKETTVLGRLGGLVSCGVII